MKSSAYLAKLSYFCRTILCSNSKLKVPFTDCLVAKFPRIFNELLNVSKLNCTLCKRYLYIYFRITTFTWAFLKQLPVNIDKGVKCSWKVDLVALSTKLSNNTFDRVCSYAFSILQRILEGWLRTEVSCTISFYFTTFQITLILSPDFDKFLTSNDKIAELSQFHWYDQLLPIFIAIDYIPN